MRILVSETTTSPSWDWFFTTHRLSFCEVSSRELLALARFPLGLASFPLGPLPGPPRPVRAGTPVLFEAIGVWSDTVWLLQGVPLFCPISVFYLCSDSLVDEC